MGAFDLSDVVWDSRVLSGGLTPEYDRFVSHLVVGGDVLRGNVLSKQSVKKEIGVFGDALGCSPASSSSVQEIKLSIGNISLSSPISFVLLESHPAFSWFSVFGGVFASSGPAAGHYLGSSSAGASEASSVTSGNSFSTASGSTLQANTLNGIAATFAGGGTRRAISINGSAVTQETTTRLPSSISAVYVATYIDAGVQQLGFRGSNYLFAVINKALSDQELRFLSANPRGLFASPQPILWVPSSGSSSILCTVGNANATGVTALISRSIPCAVGDANASGVTASITTGSSTTITCSVGNASASGVATLVSLSITAAVGNANASGVTALITSGATTITCSVGNANASGVSALILGGAVTIPCTVGDAQATGVPSMVVFKTPTPAKPPGSSAAGSGSNVRAVLPKWPTVGPVVDANGKMAQPWLHWFGGMYDRLVDTYSHQTPTDGAYLSVADGVSTLILDPAGPLASVAVRLPSTARDGMHLRITSTQTITLLYLWPADGQSLNSSPPTLAADTQIEFIFRMENRTWYRLQ